MRRRDEECERRDCGDQEGVSTVGVGNRWLVSCKSADSGSARFEELERKHIGENTPGWRWCMNPECRAGRVHEPKMLEAEPKTAKKRGVFFFSKAKSPSVTEPETCECQECGTKACIACDRPFHEGESCAAYQARIKDRVEEEDRALEAIRKVTKPCPGCKRSIQKNGGCPAMLCRSRDRCGGREGADGGYRHSMQRCFLLELSRRPRPGQTVLQVLRTAGWNMSRAMCPSGREESFCLGKVIHINHAAVSSRNVSGSPRYSLTGHGASTDIPAHVRGQSHIASVLHPAKVCSLCVSCTCNDMTEVMMLWLSHWRIAWRGVQARRTICSRAPAGVKSIWTRGNTSASWMNLDLARRNNGGWLIAMGLVWLMMM